MLISGISSRPAHRARQPFGRPARQPAAGVGAPSAAAGPAQYQVDDGGDTDDPFVRGQQPGMTLAAAQAAYASN